jgi:glucose/arabinose dehydrogenase
MTRLLPLVLVTTACNSFLSNPPPPPPPPGSPTLSLVDSFVSPVYVTSPPVDSQRLFVVEQAGRIRVTPNDTSRATGPKTFLDLRGQISAGGERGLLSVAFHPQYATNGRFYVYFTNVNGDLRIVRYNVSTTNPDSADPATADTVLKIAHPGQSNHNGGQLQFGPDGMLWIGTGDGGGYGDPNGNGQDRHSLLGKLIRLDVNGATGYVIPDDNPFKTDTAGEPEIWAGGLRNPWRFSFDRSNGDLYIGDVGQDNWEEVDVASAANGRGRSANYGWNRMEGTHCYPPDPQENCTKTGLVQPVTDYVHAFGACSITGGYVYRGANVFALQGYYVYADFCAGSVGAFKYTGSGINSQRDISSRISPGGQISSFGEDAKGELYIMTLGGPVYRVIVNPDTIP